MHWSEEEYADYRTRFRQEQHFDFDLPEASLLARVRRLAERSGWLVYHTHDSRRSPEGFPDVVLTKPGRLIFAELKSRIGKPTAEQARWLAVLARSIPGVETYLWRPGDWDEIERLLVSGVPDG